MRKAYRLSIFCQKYNNTKVKYLPRAPLRKARTRATYPTPGTLSEDRADERMPQPTSESKHIRQGTLRKPHQSSGSFPVRQQE